MNDDISTYGLLERMAVRQEGAMCKEIHLEKQTKASTHQLETC